MLGLQRNALLSTTSKVYRSEGQETAKQYSTDMYPAIGGG
jgi:hypothetical protein